MNELKDTTANLTTLTGAATAFMGWNEVLTMILILTGIVLNVIRIYSIHKKKED